MTSKKTNTLLFMLLGTLVNLVLLMFFIVAGFVILSVLVAKVPSLESYVGILTVVALILALVLAFLVYSKIVKWLTAKHGLEDKLAPLFGSKNRTPRKKED